MRDARQDYLPMTVEAFAALGAPDLVYVREVRRVDLDGVSGLEEVAPDARLFAVCAANGARVAVLDDREAAFAAARQHEMTPLSTH